MTWKIRAHFDGKVIVPEQPVDLPVGAPFQVEVTCTPNETDGTRPEVIQERLRRLARMGGCVSAPSPSDDALRRESLYD